MSFWNLFSVPMISVSIIRLHHTVLLKLYDALTSYEQESPRVEIRIVVTGAGPNMTPNSGE